MLSFVVSVSRSRSAVSLLCCRHLLCYRASIACHRCDALFAHTLAVDRVGQDGAFTRGALRQLPALQMGAHSRILAAFSHSCSFLFFLACFCARSVCVSVLFLCLSIIYLVGVHFDSIISTQIFNFIFQVDEVAPDAPWVITDEFLVRLRLLLSVSVVAPCSGLFSFATCLPSCTSPSPSLTVL